MKIKYILITLMVIVGLLIAVKIMPLWESDSCQDMGQVWDDDERRCRDDCLSWGEEYGCIKLNDTEVNLVRNCRQSRGCISREMFKDICLRNQKAYNSHTNICDFYFSAEKCGKLSAEWEYPLICNTKI